MRQMAYPVAVFVAGWIVLPDDVAYFRAHFVGGGPDNPLAYAWMLLRPLFHFGLMACILAVAARTGLLKLVWDPVSLHIWPFASLVRKLEVSFYLRALALLLRSGVDIVRSAERSAALVRNTYLRKDLLRVVQPLQSGATLAQAFSLCRYLPPFARGMLRVGEQSDLVVASDKAAELLRQEAMHPLHLGVTLVEAILILMLGGLLCSGILPF